MSQFGWQVLSLDARAEVDRIVREIRVQMKDSLKRRGAVLGLSGGIDSSVCAALLCRALGPERVFGLLMPEDESADDSLRFGRLVAETYKLPHQVEPIGDILRAARCYERRDQAIQEIHPDFSTGDRCKIVISEAKEASLFHLFDIVTEDQNGMLKRSRLSHKAYLGIVSASNFKQRARKMFEYYHADHLHYAVCGTPNRLEFDQGFFVKNGDGAADFKPIVHLYKSQVYQLAEELGVPEVICQRAPTTDTYSLPQSQEEFYFSLPYREMDLCLYAVNHGIEATTVADFLDLDSHVVVNLFKGIEAKRRTTRYLHLPPLSVFHSEHNSI